MTSTKLLAGLLVALGACPAWAINKCVGPDGKAVFQDLPCVGKGEQLVVRPASGYTGPEGAAASGVPTQLERMQRQLDQMQGDRRRAELEFALSQAYTDQTNLNAACDREIAGLQAKKGRAKNNLAGATWEQSISTEMNAIAKRCETRGNLIATRIEALRKDCQSQGGCK